MAPEDLDWIKQELEINGKAGKPVFLVTHYPMLPDDVDNCFDVTDAVRMYPVKAFLGGHYHSNRFFLYDGIPGFLNRSTLRGSAKVGGYSEYDVTPDSLIVYQHLIGSPRHRWGAISLTKSYYTEAPGSKELRPDFSVNRDYSAVHEACDVGTFHIINIAVRLCAVFHTLSMRLFLVAGYCPILVIRKTVLLPKCALNLKMAILNGMIAKLILVLMFVPMTIVSVMKVSLEFRLLP